MTLCKRDHKRSIVIILNNHVLFIADLGIVGKQCPQRLSAKDKERLDEQRVLASLRDEGFIKRPLSRAAGGYSFEIVMDKPNPSEYLLGSPIKKPPVRLEKLEKKKKKRKYTLEQIEAKLEKAEERRRVRIYHQMFNFIIRG